VGAQIAPGKLGAAAPTTFHPRPSWAPDEIEGRILLMLPYTNLTPALAASLRHTMTAERQHRVVALHKVNILDAAPTDRHVSGAGCMAGVIEQPCLDEDFFNYSILRLVWNGSPHFPRAGAPQDQSPGASKGEGCGRFSVCGRLRGPEWNPHLTSRLPASAFHVCWWWGDWCQLVSQAKAWFPRSPFGGSRIGPSGCRQQWRSPARICVTWRGPWRSLDFSNSAVRRN